MEIKNEDYNVVFDQKTTTIFISGMLLLPTTQAYQPISILMHKVLEKGVKYLTLDLSQLEFLNSAGITMLTRFVIFIRDNCTVELTLHINNQLPWQIRLSVNLQRLMPFLKKNTG